uniref:Ion_trans_2 domain-containing protein n=1 Tax=Rhabditophanes sp. KR3021 TaxID=114890 RepID=A0AC35TW93_9BILA
MYLHSIQWTWMMALFYSGQLYTTIGYGFPVAASSTGRFASIVYIILGIPLFLIFLKKIGKWMSEGLTKFYKHYKYARKATNEAKKELIRRASMMSPNKLSKPTTISEETSEDTTEIVSSKEEDDGTRSELENDIPIPLAFLIMFLWIFMSAGLFCIWENTWSYQTSIYFFVISISTVGLGDIYPSKPDMMIVNFVLIVIGLALLSMCITLIQVFIENLLNIIVNAFLEEIEKIGLEEEGSEEDLLNEKMLVFDEDHKIIGIDKSIMAHTTNFSSFLTDLVKAWVANTIVDKIQGNYQHHQAAVDKSKNCHPISNGHGVSCNQLEDGTRSIISHGRYKPSQTLKKRLSKLRQYHELPYTLKTAVLAKLLSSDAFDPVLETIHSDHEEEEDNRTLTGSVHDVKSPKPVTLSPYDNCSINTDAMDVVSNYSSQFDGSIYSAAYNDVTFGYSNETLNKIYNNKKGNGHTSPQDDSLSYHSRSNAPTPQSFRKIWHTNQSEQPNKDIWTPRLQPDCPKKY